ncbi:MAG: hypothetical protein NVSMB52_11350 [Chloroflexota bacterium]
MRLGILTMLTCIIGLFVPFVIYSVLAQAGLNISGTMYKAVAMSLALTIVLSWLVALLALAPTRTYMGPRAVDPVRGPGGASPWEEGAQTIRDLWGKRLQLETGRAMVSLGHIWKTLWTSHLPPERRLAAVDTLAWRLPFVWVSLQIPALAGFWAWHRNDSHHGNWPTWIAILAILYVLGAIPVQMTFARRQFGSRRKHRLSASVAIKAILFHLILRNTIARVAQIRSGFGFAPDPNAWPSEQAEKVWTVPEIGPTRSETEKRDEQEHLMAVSQTVLPQFPQQSITARPRLTIVGSTSTEVPHSIEGGAAVHEQPDAPSGGYAGPWSVSRNADSATSSEQSMNEPPATSPTSEPDTDEPLQAAHRVTEIVNELAGEVERLRTERTQNLATIRSLSEQLQTTESLQRAVSDAMGQPVSEEDLASMQQLMESLLKDPNHILILASVSQQASRFAEVVQSYLRIQRAVRPSP